jgi:GDPmannose 4,6-dehydratase
MMRNILQQDSHTISLLAWAKCILLKIFMEAAFEYLDLDYERHIKIDSLHFKPTEVELLQSDPSKAERQLGWKPNIMFNDLVKVMVGAGMYAAGLMPGRRQRDFETKNS